MVRADAKTQKKSSNSSIEKMTIFVCENSTFGIGGQGEVLGKKAHLRVIPLLCFSFFHFSHLYQGLTLDVSSVVGVPWRCFVLTTKRRDSWDWVGPPTWERA